MRRLIAAVALAVLLASPAWAQQTYVIWQCTEYVWFLGWTVTGSYQVWTGGEPPASAGWYNFPYYWECYPISTCYLDSSGSGTCGGMG